MEIHQKIFSALDNSPHSDSLATEMGGRVLARARLEAECIPLYQLKQWKAVSAITLSWIIIFSTAAAAVWLNHWATTSMAIIVIATRQNALFALLHHAVHHQLFKSKFLNDSISDLFLAFHLGMSTSLYRKWHFAHHQFTNSPQDPEWIGEQGNRGWQWPKKRTEAAATLLKDATGLSLRDHLGLLSFLSPWANVAALSKTERLRLGAFVIFTCAALTLMGGWYYYFIFWIIPNFTIFVALFKLVHIAEHKGLSNSNELSATRSITATVLETMLLAPHHVNYHLEHHLFPAMPFYNMPKIHAVLMRDPIFRSSACMSESYFAKPVGALWSLIRQ